jgi:Protein of unknown function (DUF3037)
MKHQYTFTVLRYFHDVVGGEFVNVGLLFYCPSGQYVALKYDRRYSRVSHFFGDSAGSELPAMIHRMAVRLQDTALSLFPERDAGRVASSILTPDSSSLQFSEIRGGVCVDPKETARQLFERYVTRYIAAAPERTTRSDQEVLLSFRHALKLRQIVGGIGERVIHASLYEHRFPIAWKNAAWHTGEPVSMDLVAPDAIVDKANKWLGRATNLAEANEKFTLHFLIGPPSSQDRSVRIAYEHALKIIGKVPLDHEIHTEKDAPRFAERVAADLAQTH